MKSFAVYKTGYLTGRLCGGYGLFERSWVFRLLAPLLACRPLLPYLRSESFQF